VSTYRFPEGFVWGAATSAYQIEGSPLADGARPSIQHRYAHTPGNCQDGRTGDHVAGHYERWAEDVALMKELGLRHYEFSMAWPRVLPEGAGAPNPKGLAFYDRLVDALLDAGVTPTPILHVWDLPGDLQDRGGWANRDVAAWFADYAGVLFELVGDRATHWYTICEPSSLAWGGHLSGVLAPAMKDLFTALRAAHHINLAHGRAVQAFRASGAGGVIGTAINVTDVHPASNREEDIAATRRVSAFENEIFLDPVFLGTYPDGLAEWFGDAWPPIHDGDLNTISEPVDFVGITYAPGSVVSASIDPAAESDPRARVLHAHIGDPGYPTTSIGWPSWPQGLVSVLTGLKDRYGDRPMIVTEEGGAFTDVIGPDGGIDDRERIAFLRDHMVAAHRAIERGVDLRGFYVWSLIDTWEFWLGLEARFGLIHVDYETQRRTLKSSGRWFANVMADNGFDSPRMEG
jgi:beta-glucosidase